MKLQTVLKRASAGLLVSLAMIGQSQATSQTNDNLMCAAYMDIAVADLYPLKVIPYDKAKQMLSSRFMRLAAASVTTNEPASTVASNFIAARNQARADLLRTSQLNAMHLDAERDIQKYAKAIDKKTGQHCLKGNASYEAMANNHSVKEIVAMSVEISKELKKRGES